MPLSEARRHGLLCRMALLRKANGRFTLPAGQRGMGRVAAMPFVAAVPAGSQGRSDPAVTD